MPVFRARYKGTCRKCGLDVAPGTYVSWSRLERGVIYHAACIGETPPPTGDGESQASGEQTSGEAQDGEQASEQTTSEAQAQASIDEARVREIAREEALLGDGRILEAVEERLSRTIPTTLTVTVRRDDGGSQTTIAQAHHMLKSLVYLAGKRRHVYLYGPPGSGKSTGAVQAAQALGERYGYASLNPQTPESRLLGFIDAGGTYRETEFFRCYKWCGTADCDCCTGGLFCIDELDNGHPALLNTLNGMLEVDADGVGRGAFPCGVVLRHPRFVCVATGNTNGRGADKLFPERRALDAAFLERFTFLAWEYDEALEQAITLKINREAGMAWLRWVRKVRAYVAENSIRLWASPRASFTGADMLRDSGWTPATIADAVLFKGLDKDTVERIVTACPLPQSAVES